MTNSEKKEGWFSRFKRMSKVKKALVTLYFLSGFLGAGADAALFIGYETQTPIKLQQSIKAKTNKLASEVEKLKIDLNNYGKSPDPQILTKIKSELKAMNIMWNALKGGNLPGKDPKQLKDIEELDQQIKSLNAIIIEL